MRISAQPTCSSDAPDARITVYSELATSCASANSVPISVATGKSSYMRDGSCSADEEQRRRDRVAAAPDVAQLVDQVEEREQHHERGEDQQDRARAPRGRCSA